jgi:hypothetical protein
VCIHRDFHCSFFKTSNQLLVYPSNGRLNRSFFGSSLPLGPSSGDHRVQQALFMGCPDKPHAVSFSPPGGNDVQATSSFVRPSISHHYMPLPLNILQPAPRVMYSSLPYTPGNPGFYYDLMQNSVHAGSKTTPYMPNPRSVRPSL